MGLEVSFETSSTIIEFLDIFINIQLIFIKISINI